MFDLEEGDGNPHGRNRWLRAVGRVILSGEKLEAGARIEPAYMALQAVNFPINTIDCATQPPDKRPGVPRVASGVNALRCNNQAKAPMRRP